jgi:hypothetical protein
MSPSTCSHRSRAVPARWCAVRRQKGHEAASPGPLPCPGDCPILKPMDWATHAPLWSRLVLNGIPSIRIPIASSASACQLKFTENTARNGTGVTSFGHNAEFWAVGDATLSAGSRCKQSPHWLSWLSIGDSESAFVLQPVLDLVEPPFTGRERRGAGMHRVGSEHEVVGVRSRRPNVELLLREETLPAEETRQLRTPSPRDQGCQGEENQRSSWRRVEHGEVGHDGSSHDTREQHASERGLAWNDEQQRAQHFKRSGDVSEPSVTIEG